MVACKMYTIAFLIGLILLSPSDINAQQESDLPNVSADLAFESIREAQLAGADVSDLVDSFNVALDLIYQTENSKFHSCTSYEDCNEQAIKIFVNLTNDAHILKEQVAVETSVQKSLNFIYASIIAFVFSVMGYFIFKTLKLHRTKRLLEMEIKVKQK